MTGAEEAEEEEEGLFSSMEEGLFSSISLLGKLTVSNELGISEDVSISGSPSQREFGPEKRCLEEGQKRESDLGGPLPRGSMVQKSLPLAPLKPESAQTVRGLGLVALSRGGGWAGETASAPGPTTKSALSL